MDEAAGFDRDQLETISFRLRREGLEVTPLFAGDVVRKRFELTGRDDLPEDPAERAALVKRVASALYEDEPAVLRILELVDRDPALRPRRTAVESVLSPDGRWIWDGTVWKPAQLATWPPEQPQPPAAPGPPAWSAPYASPADRATFVVTAFAALLVTYGLVIGGDVLAIGIAAAAGGRPTADQQALVALVQGAASFLALIGLLGTAVAFCMWEHRMYRNLPALGAGLGLRSSPRAAVLWWFVPFASLWMPFRVMREIWQRTAPAGTGASLLGIWWALYVAGSYAGGVVLRIWAQNGSNEALDAAVNALNVIAAVAAIIVVRRLTAWQVGQADLITSPLPAPAGSPPG